MRDGADPAGGEEDAGNRGSAENDLSPRADPVETFAVAGFVRPTPPRRTSPRPRGDTELRTQVVAFRRRCQTQSVDPDPLKSPGLAPDPIRVILAETNPVRRRRPVRFPEGRGGTCHRGPSFFQAPLFAQLFLPLVFVFVSELIFVLPVADVLFFLIRLIFVLELNRSQSK